MWPTSLIFDYVSSFNYDEVAKLFPYITHRQRIILNDSILMIDSILKGISEATRLNRIEDITTYEYYGKFPLFCKEDKMFYFAAIVSYLMYKDFQVSYKIIDEEKYFLHIQW